MFLKKPTLVLLTALLLAPLSAPRAADAANQKPNIVFILADDLGAWLPQIEKWGLRLGLEVGAIKPWGLTGQRAFEVQRPKWDRFQSLGGKIRVIALDEPLVCCRSHIKRPDEYAVEETAQLLAFLDALQARLKAMNVRGLDFFRLDVACRRDAAGLRLQVRRRRAGAGRDPELGRRPVALGAGGRRVDVHASVRDLARKFVEDGARDRR